MISGFSLISALAWSVVAVAAAPDVVPLDTAPNNCKFTVGDQRFDLCPVLSGNQGSWVVEYEYPTPPTLTKTSYTISLRGALQKKEDVPDYAQCPDGAWICMIMTNRRWKDTEEPRVVQVIPVAGALAPSDRRHDYYPGLNWTLELAKDRGNPDAKHDLLRVRLHGGYYVRQHQRADLYFVCDHQAEEPTQPTAAWTWGGTHAFTWKTKYACGRTMNAPEPEPEPQPPMPRPADGDTPSADPPAGDDEQEFIDPDMMGRRTRQSMMTIFASTAFLVAVVVYIVYFPPRRFRQFVTSYMKAHPTLMRARVGEHVLVRWADEDFVLEGGEEDTMVNADELFDAMDEQIPLKPSPRRTSLNPMNYGTQ